MAKKQFYQSIARSRSEEELKFKFASYLKLGNYDTSNYIDLYTPEILFEFKYRKNFQNQKTFAVTVAQALYYVQRLYSGKDYRAFSPYISVVTNDFGAYFKTDTFSDFYSNANRYDWDLPPSSPCKILVDDLLSSNVLSIDNDVYDFKDKSSEIKFVTDIQRIRKIVLTPSKRQITPNNFDDIFTYWQSLFGKAVKNSHKPSEYFITDIEGDKSEIRGDNVVFSMTDGQKIAKPIDIDLYKRFWSQYERIRNHDTIIAVRQRMDRMTEENLRRFTGEFYTPKLFADKAVEYLTKTVPNCFTDDNFRLWDMAAGTGNLECALPEDFLRKCYISTLHKDEAAYCAETFTAATCFQYDFLNDDDSKLPQNLRDDLNNPDIKWIIFINPPYVTANNKKNKKNNVNKNKVSMTKIKKLMTAEHLGKTSQELFTQFIYRICRDFAGKTVYLGMFSTLKYVNAEAEQNLRDKYFKCKN